MQWSRIYIGASEKLLNSSFTSWILFINILAIGLIIRLILSFELKSKFAKSLKFLIFKLSTLNSHKYLAFEFIPFSFKVQIPFVSSKFLNFP